MTVWIYQLGDGEYEEVATVENGSVVSGDEALVRSAFPDGVPDDEGVVARAFDGTATVATTDFDLDWDAEPEWAREAQALSGAGEGNDYLADAPEWDRPLLEMHAKVTDPDSDPSRTLVSYAESATPEFVLERIREAIMSGSLFSSFEEIPSSRLMELREEFADALTEEGGFTLDSITDQLMEFEEDLDREEAERIARTETTATLNEAREQSYQEKDMDGDERYYWTGASPGDARQTDACGYLIAGQGGHLENSGAFSGLERPNGTNPFEGGTPMQLEDLQEHVKEVARADPEINTSPRDWCPHINCRSTFVMAPE